MIHTAQLSFDASERAVLDEVDRDLSAQGWGKGWAVPLTVVWLLRNWQIIAEKVNQYDLTIDDYTNDLTTRDALDIVLVKCAEPLRTKLKIYIETCDREFIARTEEDIENTMGRFYLIDTSSEWWWRRKPKRGLLAQYLADEGREPRAQKSP
jgi:hypothetical protein